MAQAHEYTVPEVGALAPFPDPPVLWSEGPTTLLDALAAAAATACDETTRYALNCLQLRGGTGELAATDGHQLLVQGGCRFPWTGDVLIQRTPLFACKDWPRDRPLALGKTDTHVVLRIGPWTVFCAIQEARFPAVDHVVPGASEAATRLRLEVQDAVFLAEALGALPGSDECNAPVTLDLNGCVAVRARGASQERATELVLARSGYTGPPVRLNTNRAFLARALRLGFTTLEIAGPDAPLVGRDGTTTYAWQPLAQESALAPSDDVTRIEPPSPSFPPRPALAPAAPHRGVHAVNSKTTVPRLPAADAGTTTGRVALDGAGGLAALIREAESLHEALADARNRTGRLVVALRRQRKRDRLVATTLASLKQLKLQEAAE